MKRILAFATCIMLFGTAQAQTHNILFQTAYGDIKVVLYDFTPNHRDLILEAIQDSVYSDALFNRIIKDFVVQGGEHDIDIEKREKANPTVVKPRLPPEFDDRAFHKIGALGAGRDDNPQKASFLNQIYFVVGKAVTADDLSTLEAYKGIKYTTTQRQEYLTRGGLPRLDHDYTVFGEIYEGLEVIHNISQLPTDARNYPLEEVQFKLSVIK